MKMMKTKRSFSCD